MNAASLNHTDIYMLLYHGDITGAVGIFRKKTDENGFTPAARGMYLSSLNFGIYNYILMKENISLHDCCYENEKKITNVTKDSFITIGIDIINSYGMDKRYMIEKYSNVHIKNAMYYIHTHINEQLSLRAVSEAVNLNPSYLCQLFKKEVHTSFSNYITTQRIKLAKGLLNCTDYSIEEISEKCGFKSTAYFSTCYKKALGIPPSHERRLS